MPAVPINCFPFCKLNQICVFRSDLTLHCTVQVYDCDFGLSFRFHSHVPALPEGVLVTWLNCTVVLNLSLWMYFEGAVLASLAESSHVRGVWVTWMDGLFELMLRAGVLGNALGFWWIQGLGWS